MPLERSQPRPRAAVRYQSDTRNPAYAPTAHHRHDRDEDAA
jgi:hypothetical protein